MDDVLHKTSEVIHFVTRAHPTEFLFLLGLIIFLLFLPSKKVLKIFMGIGIFLTLPFLLTLLLVLAVCVGKSCSGNDGMIFVLPFMAFFPAVPGAIILIPAALKLFWINRNLRNNPDSDAES